MGCWMRVCQAKVNIVSELLAQNTNERDRGPDLVPSQPCRATKFLIKVPGIGNVSLNN
jgi:hypothetical protein